MLTLAKNPVALTDNDERLTRRQLLRALVKLTCLDHRAVHPSERKYIDQQQLLDAGDRGRADDDDFEDAHDTQLAEALEQVCV